MSRHLQATTSLPYLPTWSFRSINCRQSKEVITAIISVAIPNFFGLMFLTLSEHGILLGTPPPKAQYNKKLGRPWLPLAMPVTATTAFQYVDLDWKNYETRKGRTDSIRYVLSPSDAVDLESPLVTSQWQHCALTFSSHPSIYAEHEAHVDMPWARKAARAESNPPIIFSSAY